MPIFALIMLGSLVALGVCHLFFPAAVRWLFELRNRLEGTARPYQPEDRADQRSAGALIILFALACILFVLVIAE